MKKIKIKVNGKIKSINENNNLLNLINFLKIPIKKVAIELNEEIVDKRKLRRKESSWHLRKHQIELPAFLCKDSFSLKSPVMSLMNDCLDSTLDLLIEQRRIIRFRQVILMIK